MNRNSIYHLLLTVFLFLGCFTLQTEAGEMTFSGPENPALVISGSGISKGRGFLHNYVAISPSELHKIAVSASGEATYRLGLGDCFSEAVTYSTYEDHGTPAWIYRRVYGLDLQLMAESLGIDTDQVMSISVYADDGMSKTLTDAFGIKNSRWTYDFTGTKVNQVSPILALYETTSETPVLSEGVLPDMPVIGPDSTDRVDNVFGYGQTDIQEITSCYWVKNVRRLRFGTESSALTVRDPAGSAIDISISTLLSRGIWNAVIGTVKAQGVPVLQLLSDSGIDVPAGYTLSAQSIDSTIQLSTNELAHAFVAWQATDNGSAIHNATALRLYYGNGQILPDMFILSVIPADEADAPPVVETGFTDLDNYSWATDAVIYLTERGVVKGLSSTRFGPELNIKRGDFMLMLARAYDLDAEYTDNFSDVPADSYYHDAIAAARALGIAKGDGGFFKPESSITRQEAFALLHRTLSMAGLKLTGDSSVLSSFRDGDQIAVWARNPVSSLIAAGVIQGSDNTVNPLGMLTRAEMAVILERALTLQ